MTRGGRGAGWLGAPHEAGDRQVAPIPTLLYLAVPWARVPSPRARLVVGEHASSIPTDGSRRILP